VNDDVTVTSSETTLSRTASGKDTIFLSNNFMKLKRIVVIFAKHYEPSKEKLTV